MKNTTYTHAQNLDREKTLKVEVIYMENKMHAACYPLVN